MRLTHTRLIWFFTKSKWVSNPEAILLHQIASVWLNIRHPAFHRTMSMLFSFTCINIIALRGKKYPVIVGPLCAYDDKSLRHIAAWCKAVAIRFGLQHHDDDYKAPWQTSRRSFPDEDVLRRGERSPLFMSGVITPDSLPDEWFTHMKVGRQSCIGRLLRQRPWWPTPCEHLHGMGSRHVHHALKTMR